MEGGPCGSTHSTFFLLEEKGRQFPSLKLLASLNDINLSDITVGSHPPSRHGSLCSWNLYPLIPHPPFPCCSGSLETAMLRHRRESDEGKASARFPFGSTVTQRVFPVPVFSPGRAHAHAC